MVRARPLHANAEHFLAFDAIGASVLAVRSKVLCRADLPPPEPFYPRDLALDAPD